MLAEAGSFSPSAGKPRHVLAAWQAAELPITVLSITPASEKDLCLAHDPAYVRGVLEGKVSSGFGNTSLEVARSLPYTSGAMIAASRAALEVGCACAPVSSFHHAQYDSAAGFCTVYADGPFPIAKKLKDPTWRKQLTDSVVGRAIHVEAISYQELIRVARQAAVNEDIATLDALSSWVQKKCDDVGRHLAS